jgi:hypothetical protein
MQIREKYMRVSNLLTPAVKKKVRQIIPHYLANTGGLRQAHVIHQSALTALRSKFPSWTPAQMDFLAFYLLSVAAINDSAKGDLDSMNEMSEMSSMRLQMAMDRRSKFVEALSNIMKKIDSTQETIVQNLKG